MRETDFTGLSVAPRVRPGFAVSQAARDTLRLLRGPRFGPVVAVGVGIAALSGPFGTYEQLSGGLRLGYWTLLIAGPALLLTWLSFLVWHLTEWSVARVALAAWALGLVPVWLLVVGLERWLPFDDPVPALELLPLVALPLLGVTLLANWFNLPAHAPTSAPTRAVVAAMAAADVVLRAPRPPEPLGAPDPAPGPAPAGDPVGPSAGGVLARLPLRLGRELVSLNAQGHYLEVVTLKGKALILMPISQAEAELSGWPGMRVHRSWWVNLPHVRRAVSRNGRLELELATGQRVPVARALVRPVRAALDRHGPPDLAG